MFTYTFPINYSVPPRKGAYVFVKFIELLLNGDL